jgi:hypothetical protein
MFSIIENPAFERIRQELLTFFTINTVLYWPTTMPFMSMFLAAFVSRPTVRSQLAQWYTFEAFGSFKFPQNEHVFVVYASFTGTTSLPSVPALYSSRSLN